jgi:hypothetical protein
MLPEKHEVSGHGFSRAIKAPLKEFGLQPPWKIL